MTAGTASKEQLPFDLTILRSFRVLRPLKLVSKVPSKLRGLPKAIYTVIELVFVVLKLLVVKRKVVGCGGVVSSLFLFISICILL